MKVLAVIFWVAVTTAIISYLAVLNTSHLWTAYVLLASFITAACSGTLYTCRKNMRAMSKPIFATGIACAASLYLGNSIFPASMLLLVIFLFSLFGFITSLLYVLYCTFIPKIWRNRTATE